MNYANDHRRQQTDSDIDLANLMRKEYEALSPLSPECCIYRVSDRLRQVNEKAYTPQVVSIGPLHHGKEWLKPMEEHKIRFLRAYIERTKKPLEEYIDIVKNSENKIRCSYAEPLHHDTNALVKIVLTDVAFIIEVLLRNRVAAFQDDHDRIFKKPWKLQDMSPDLRMLENQLPFFIVEALYFPEHIKFPSEVISNERSIVKLLHNFFKEQLHLEGTKEIMEKISLSSSDSKPKHFVDFLRKLYIPNEDNNGGELKTLSTPSVTELHHAGVKFRQGQSQNIFDIEFSNGVLKIPKLTISDETDLTIRNLLAFEQCHCEVKNYLNDYAVMLDRLVNTANDVDLLVKFGVVENLLGDSGEAALLVNRLGDGATHETKEFYFASISKKLDAHCKTSWHQWKANLRQNYFNTPWSIASVIAAVLLIALTVIQAVCSVISVIKKD